MNIGICPTALQEKSNFSLKIKSLESILSIFQISNETFKSSKTILEFLSKIYSKEMSAHLSHLNTDHSNLVNRKIRKLSRIFLHKLAQESFSYDDMVSIKCEQIVVKIHSLVKKNIILIREEEDKQNRSCFPKSLDEYSDNKFDFYTKKLNKKLIQSTEKIEDIQYEKLKDLINDKLKITTDKFEKGEKRPEELEEIFLLMEKLNTQDRKIINFDICYHLFDYLSKEEFESIARESYSLDIYTTLRVLIIDTLKEIEEDKLISNINFMIKLCTIYNLAEQRDGNLFFNISPLVFSKLSRHIENNFFYIVSKNSIFFNEIFMPYLISNNIKKNNLDEAVKFIPKKDIHFFKKDVNLLFKEGEQKNLFHFFIMTYIKDSYYKDLNSLKKDFATLRKINIPNLTDYLVQNFLKYQTFFQQERKLDLLQLIENRDTKKKLTKTTYNNGISTSYIQLPEAGEGRDCPEIEIPKNNEPRQESLINKINNLTCINEDLLEAENILECSLENPPEILRRKIHLIKWFLDPIWDYLLDPEVCESKNCLLECKISDSQKVIKLELKKMLKRYGLKLQESIDSEIEKYLEGDENLDFIFNEILEYRTKPYENEKAIIFEEEDFIDHYMSDSDEEGGCEKEKELDSFKESEFLPKKEKKETTENFLCQQGQNFDFESLNALFQNLKKLDKQKIKEAFKDLKEQLQNEKIEDEVLLSILVENDLTDLYFEE